jgi:hypothetical protein
MHSRRLRCCLATAVGNLYDLSGVGGVKNQLRSPSPMNYKTNGNAQPAARGEEKRVEERSRDGRGE